MNKRNNMILAAIVACGLAAVSAYGADAPVAPAKPVAAEKAPEAKHVTTTGKAEVAKPTLAEKKAVSAEKKKKSAAKVNAEKGVKPVTEETKK